MFFLNRPRYHNISSIRMILCHARCLCTSKQHVPIAQCQLNTLARDQALVMHYHWGEANASLHDDTRRRARVVTKYSDDNRRARIVTRYSDSNRRARIVSCVTRLNFTSPDALLYCYICAFCAGRGVRSRFCASLCWVA